MLTLEQCRDFAALNDETVHAIAVHERLPHVVAIERGSALMESSEGIALIKRYLAQELAQARRLGQLDRARRVWQAYSCLDAADSGLIRRAA